MAAVAITALDRFTNVTETTGAVMSSVDDYLEVPRPLFQLFFRRQRNQFR
jgi:hypothetical protein